MKTTTKTKTKKRRAKKPIGKIDEERAACIAAFKKYPHARFVWCCHHEELFERNRGFRNRLRCIAKDKSYCERAVRYRNYRPMKKATDKPSIAQLNREWPDNTWGKARCNESIVATIFSGIGKVRVW
jgi:hypothetical protein